MFRSVFILGRQPAIGRAELESLFGTESVAPLGHQAAFCTLDPREIPFDRIGSATRLARFITTLDTTNWSTIQTALIKQLPSYISELPEEGKIKLGVSVFDVSVGTRQLLRTGLELKKVAKQTGRSIRLVPNNENALSTAQVIHNSLTGELGLELLLIRYGNKTVVAQTTDVQDINAYAKRDQERPKRDAFVGMLPPKLAQTIINLATAQAPQNTDTIVLDPFCGTGVVLQESLLMGYGAYGSDLETRMVDYSAKNLTWLHDKYGTPADVPVETGDATTHTWKHSFTTVACESYLGHPLANWPRPEKLDQIVGTCNLIIEKFLRNLHDQVPKGTRMCVAVPAWIHPEGRITHLPMLDYLEKIGYNRISFEYARESDLIYHRSDQIVGRELLIIVTN